MGRNRVLVLLTAGAFASAASPSLAAGPGISGDRSARAGKTAAVTLALASAGSCRASLAGRSGGTSIVSPGSIRFTIKLSSKARSGRYPVKLTCDGWSGSRTLTVKGRKRGTKKVASKVTASTLSKRSGSSALDDKAEAFYQDFKRSMTGTGECVDYAIQRREDLYRALTYPQLRRFVEAGGAKPVVPTDARTWPRFASENGVRIDNTPRVGALLVLAAGTFGASPQGHLGIVDKVNRNGSVVFSSMNWTKGRGIVMNETLPASMVSNAGIKFIG